MTELDHGTRCDDHVGEVFPVRCAQCETLRAEFSLWPNLTSTHAIQSTNPTHTDQETN
jgi:hypothetical protein